MQGEWLRNRVQKLCLCGKNRLTGSFSFKDCLRNGKASVEKGKVWKKGQKAGKQEQIIVPCSASFQSEKSFQRALIQMRKAQKFF